MKKRIRKPQYTKPSIKVHYNGSVYESQNTFALVKRLEVEFPDAIITDAEDFVIRNKGEKSVKYKVDIVMQLKDEMYLIESKPYQRFNGGDRYGWFDKRMLHKLATFGAVYDRPTYYPVLFVNDGDGDGYALQLMTYADHVIRAFKTGDGHLLLNFEYHKDGLNCFRKATPNGMITYSRWLDMHYGSEAA